MPKVSLSKQVEDIVFSRSALPEVLTPEKLSGILYSLGSWSQRETWGTAKCVFGADSICARSSSFLISQGCPAHSRVENSFAAAAAHSELGKMLQWFASAVVTLFVDGVKSGIMFPKQWEESVRRHPTLSKYTFELQGFSVLFSYLVCQLAAAESALSGTRVHREYNGANGDFTPQFAAETKANNGDFTPQFAAETKANNGDFTPQFAAETKANVHCGIAERDPRCVQRDESGNCVTTHVTSDVGVPVVAVLGKQMPSFVASAPKNLHKAPSGVMQSSDVECAENCPEKTPVHIPPAVKVRRIQRAQSHMASSHVLLKKPSEGEVQSKRSFSGEGRGSSLKSCRHSGSNFTDSSLKISSIAIPSMRREDAREDVDTLGETSRLFAFPHVASAPSSLLFADVGGGREGFSKRGRFVCTPRNVLSVEDFEEQIQLSKLARAYGVQKIVNYARRDLQEHGKNVQMLRDMIDAEDDCHSDVRHTERRE